MSRRRVVQTLYGALFAMARVCLASQGTFGLDRKTVQRWVDRYKAGETMEDYEDEGIHTARQGRIKF